MKTAYPVIFASLNDDKNIRLIEIPDLKISTEGYRTADAIYIARDAIELKGIAYEDNKKNIPTPSEFSEIDLSSGIFTENRNSYISAEKAYLNVSRILQEALMAKLETR